MSLSAIPLLDTLATLAWAVAGAAAGYAMAPVVRLFHAYEPDPEDDFPPPPPACPRCGDPVRWARWAPFPVRLLGARRCASCAAPTLGSIAVVVGTTAVFAALAARFGPGLELLAFSFLATVGVPLAVIDVRTQRLPNPLVLPAYPVALVLLAAAAVVSGISPLLSALLGMAGAAACYGLLWLIHPAGMGWGDVKLSGLVGLYLGWTGLGSVVTGIFAAFLSAAAVGLVLLAAGRATRKTHIPHGPFMLLGALAVILAGDALPPLAAIPSP